MNTNSTEESPIEGERKKEGFKNWLIGKIGRMNYVNYFPAGYAEIEVVRFADEYANSRSIILPSQEEVYKQFPIDVHSNEGLFNRAGVEWAIQRVKKLNNIK